MSSHSMLICSLLVCNFNVFWCREIDLTAVNVSSSPDQHSDHHDNSEMGEKILRCSCHCSASVDHFL